LDHASEFGVSVVLHKFQSHGVLSGRFMSTALNVALTSNHWTEFLQFSCHWAELWIACMAVWFDTTAIGL